MAMVIHWYIFRALCREAAQSNQLILDCRYIKSRVGGRFHPIFWDFSGINQFCHLIYNWFYGLKVIVSMARIGLHFWRINSSRNRCSLFNVGNDSDQLQSTIVIFWHKKPDWSGFHQQKPCGKAENVPRGILNSASSCSTAGCAHLIVLLLWIGI